MTLVKRLFAAVRLCTRVPIINYLKELLPFGKGVIKC